MLNDAEGLLKRVITGEIDQSSVSQAANDNISNMDHQQLTEHVQNAADNANQNGEGGLAQQLIGLVSQHGSNPEGLKGEVISLITNNPQILQHFEPSFARNILGNI